ncbi:glycerate kinase [Coccinella septempunctata]|uniref:glycerate kinase n=1 Tax=Coccinella septempunctata TaxID=41139 RepID=UPI001D064DC2|nr:glycerate kinase [Coccinella septempunctata]
MSKAESIIRELFRLSVSAVKPYALIQQNISVNGRHLLVRDKTHEIIKPARVVGFGKAVHGMATALEETLGSLLERAIVCVPEGSLNVENLKSFDATKSKIEFLEGANNNLPDENAMYAALKIRDFVQNLDEDDTVIVLISGGGSALLPLPKGRITLSEKLELVKKLGNAGANIFEMNCVRKELSVLKGGGLARHCYPAKVITLILSDVIGDPIDIIASGPTCPNHDGPGKAIEVLKKFSLYQDLPTSIRETLENSLKLEKSYAQHERYFQRVDNFIIGNNRIATQAILSKTQELGVQSVILSTDVSGDVEEISTIYAKIAEIILSFLREETTKDELIEALSSVRSNSVTFKMDKLSEDVKSLDTKRDLCVILAGEPTVLVTGGGIGGRNQQLALSFSLKISPLEKIDPRWDVWFLSCGTDGIDGPTDAAGAIGSSQLERKCIEENLNPREYLDNNDCYSFYSRFMEGKYLVKVGHTGTNVMDVHLIFFEAQ